MMGTWGAFCTVIRLLITWWKTRVIRDVYKCGWWWWWCCIVVVAYWLLIGSRRCAGGRIGVAWHRCHLWAGRSIVTRFVVLVGDDSATASLVVWCRRLITIIRHIPRPLICRLTRVHQVSDFHTRSAQGDKHRVPQKKDWVGSPSSWLTETGLGELKKLPDGKVW